MAEFQQIMKEWRRMCLSFKSCGDCPMMDEDGCAHILCSEGGIQSAVPDIQEAVIKKWAAEHPEPVYPTWGQYFRRYYGLEYCKDKEYEMLLEHIPADIAQKLGIEPK